MFNQPSYLNQKPKTPQRVEIEDIVQKVCRHVKIYNQKSLIGFEGADLTLFADNLEREYSLATVRNAYDEFLKNHLSQNVTLGVFAAKCHEIHAIAMERQKTQDILNRLNFKSKNKEVGRYWLGIIKETLRVNGAIIKDLPYDKNVREPG